MPATTANSRAASPAEGAAEPLLWAPPFVGYCPILLRSWWPAAPPAKLDSSLWEVSGSTSFGGVWLVEAGVGLVVGVVEVVEVAEVAEVCIVGAGVEVVTRVVAAGVVG